MYTDTAQTFHRNQSRHSKSLHSEPCVVYEKQPCCFGAGVVSELSALIMEQQTGIHERQIFSSHSPEERTALKYPPSDSRYQIITTCGAPKC
jgi:hypothetical protein